METRREAVKDIIRDYLERWLKGSHCLAYEHACNLADCVFYALGISEAEQDMPPEISMPRRLPIVTIKGRRFFLDVRLRQFRNLENPRDFIDF